MLTTQEFADLCSTTKKTIIYYDTIGLLKPTKLNNQNRLYLPKQVLTFQKITLLKSLGLTLKETKQHLKSDSTLPKLFSTRKTELTKERDKLINKINKLDEFVSSFQSGSNLIIPEIKTIKPHLVYGLDISGRYIDIAKYQQKVFSIVGDKQDIEAGLTVFYTPTYSPHQSKMTTGVVVKHKPNSVIKELQLIKVPEYKAVTYTHVGPYSFMSYIWQYMDNFVKEKKLKRHPELATREFYRVGPLKEKDEYSYITELQIPII
jgi:DNA-binding transcriptional MerR regulator